MALKNIYLTLPVGETVRDHLVLGTAGRLLDLLPDSRIVLLSPSHNVPEFLAICPKDERVVTRRMELPVGVGNWRLIHFRKKLRRRSVIQLLLGWETRRMTLPPYLKRTFEEFPPAVVVSTHPMRHFDYDVVTWARRLGVQTLGVVKSWDNIQKGLSTHCHLLSVWNPVNQEEAQRLIGYRSEEVEINGAPSFDAYYDPEFQVAREEAMTSLGLDPSRPLITLATCGPLGKGYHGRDETHLIDDILAMIRESDTLRKAQLVVRLHPDSHLEYFWKYWNRPGIKVSFATVMPAVEWCPTRNDLIEQTNLLRYSDVIVTPGSSWVLEAAIFDRPTVVPVYSDLQPDHAAALFDRWTLARHFRPLVEGKLVQITRSFEETRTAIEEAFNDPKRHAEARKAIVDRYVFHRDSESSLRVAQWIAHIARNTKPGRPRGY